MIVGVDIYFERGKFDRHFFTRCCIYHRVDQFDLKVAILNVDSVVECADQVSQNITSGDVLVYFFYFIRSENDQTTVFQFSDKLRGCENR